MTYFIFKKSLRSLEEFRKILMSKFHLNLLVNFLKVLSKSKFIQNSKINFRFNLFLGSGPAGPVIPALAHLTTQVVASRSAQSAQVPLGALFGICFLSLLSQTHEPCHQLHPLPSVPLKPSHAAASHNCSRPPHVT
jgi:hypothetical protein